jgi:hypothetical protein
MLICREPAALLEDFDTYLMAHKLCATTRAEYRGHVHKFLCWCKTTHVVAFNEDTAMQSYLDQLRMSGYSGANLKIMRTALEHFERCFRGQTLRNG